MHRRLSVCISVVVCVSPAEVNEPINMQFGVWTCEAHRTVYYTSIQIPLSGILSDHRHF